MHHGKPVKKISAYPKGVNAASLKHTFRDLLPFIAFFLVSYIWYVFAADYVLFFQEKSSLFVFPELASETISKPGGFLVSFSELLTSFYYFPAAGGFILAGVLTAIVFFISRILLLLSGRNEKIFPFIAGLLLFFLHTDYRFMLYNSTGIILQVAAFYLTIKSRNVLNGFTPLVIFPVLYFLTGAFAWIWLAAIILNTLVTPSGKRFLIPFLLLVSGLTLTISQYLFFSNIESLAVYPLSLPENTLQRTALIMVAALVIMVPLISQARFPLTQFISIKYSTERFVRSAIITVLLVITGIATYNKKDATYFKAEKIFYQGSFERLNEYNIENPTGNILTLFFNNIALAKRGILNDRLFSFPQSSNGETLFLKWEMVAEKLKRGGYFYYNVGMINEAHRWAFENMVMKGYTPEGLKLLARTELINGHYEMASKYISLLGKTIFYRKEAIHLARFLFNDKAVWNDPELGIKRRMNVRAEFFSLTDNPEINVERIFASDSMNRPAFDYKVARMMISKDYKGIESVLPVFGTIGYKEFPLHVEEVIMMIALSNNDKMPDLGGLQVRVETIRRWEQFLSVFQQYGSNARNAEPSLRKQFGKTFWYWAFYK